MLEDLLNATRKYLTNPSDDNLCGYYIALNERCKTIPNGIKHDLLVNRLADAIADFEMVNSEETETNLLIHLAAAVHLGRPWDQFEVRETDTSRRKAMTAISQAASLRHPLLNAAAIPTSVNHQLFKVL